MPRKPERILPFRENLAAHESIRGLLNLGAKSSQWLNEAGIDSVEKIRSLGPIEVCRQLRAKGRLVSVVMAYALEGALSGCHWNAIPWETKQSLRTAFAAMKRGQAPHKESIRRR